MNDTTVCPTINRLSGLHNYNYNFIGFLLRNSQSAENFNCA